MLTIRPGGMSGLDAIFPASLRNTSYMTIEPVNVTLPESSVSANSPDAGPIRVTEKSELTDEYGPEERASERDSERKAGWQGSDSSEKRYGKHLGRARQKLINHPTPLSRGMPNSRTQVTPAEIRPHTH